MEGARGDGERRRRPRGWERQRTKNVECYALKKQRRAEAEEREGEYGACDAAAARWWISEEVQSRVLVEIANARSGTTLRSASEGKRRENQIRIGGGGGGGERYAVSRWRYRRGAGGCG